jgi:hypothetical protein
MNDLNCQVTGSSSVTEVMDYPVALLISPQMQNAEFSEMGLN